MAAIFHNGNNYSAVSTNEVADKATLDEMKTKLESMSEEVADKATLDEMKTMLDEMKEIMLVMSEMLSSGTKSYETGNTAPGDTALLWIDTSSGGILKYYDETSSSWVPTKSAWG